MTPANGFFFRKTVGNVSVPTWRTKFLVWLMPVLFILAGIVLLTSSFMWVKNATETTGTVVKVSEYVDSFSGETVFDPVISYTWTNGSIIESKVGAPRPAIAFQVGDTHTILFNPDKQDKIRLAGFASHYMIGSVILAVGILFSLISLLLWVGVNAIARNRDSQPKASS